MFVSYRREDARPYARDLARRLGERFGPDRVFVDLERINPGERFRDRIEGAMAGARLVVAVISPRWLGGDGDGAPRIARDGDWVRLEVRTALERGLPVMPVLVGHAALPAAESLPDDLRALLEYHAIEISEERYDYDVGRLLDAAEALLGAVAAPAARAAEPLREAPAPPTEGIDPAHLLDEVRVLDRVVNWKAAGRARGLLEAGEAVLGVAAVSYAAEKPTFTGEPPAGLVLATDRRLLSVPNRSRLAVRSIPYAGLALDVERTDAHLCSYTLRSADGDLPLLSWTGEGLDRFLEAVRRRAGAPLAGSGGSSGGTSP